MIMIWSVLPSCRNKVVRNTLRLVSFTRPKSLGTNRFCPRECLWKTLVSSCKIQTIQAGARNSSRSMIWSRPLRMNLVLSEEVWPHLTLCRNISWEVPTKPISSRKTRGRMVATVRDIRNWRRLCCFPRLTMSHRHSFTLSKLAKWSGKVDLKYR